MEISESLLAEIQELAKRWKMEEFYLFGSILTADFRPDSDVDVLVEFRPDAPWSLFDLVDLREELKKLFKREVDLIEKRCLLKSRNPLRREHILLTAKKIYMEAV